MLTQEDCEFEDSLSYMVRPCSVTNLLSRAKAQVWILRPNQTKTTQEALANWFLKGLHHYTLWLIAQLLWIFSSTEFCSSF